MKKKLSNFANVFLTALGFLLSPALLASFVVIVIFVMTESGNSQPLALVGAVFIVLLIKDLFEVWSDDDVNVHDDVLTAVKAAGKDGITSVEIARRTSIGRADVKEVLCDLSELHEVIESDGKVFAA